MRRVAAVLAGLALAASAAWALWPAPSVVSSSVDAGGGVAAAAGAAVYSMIGTAGQADAGVLSGGAFKLQGGFVQSDDAYPYSAVQSPWRLY